MMLSATPVTKRWVLLGALVVVVVVAVLLWTVGPLSPSTRQHRLQTQALAVYTAMMTDWVADEPNDWGNRPAVPSFYNEYLVDPAWTERAVTQDRLRNFGGSVASAGVPYFAVAGWAPLSDPVGHGDALVGLTVCWVQGNLVTTTIDVAGNKTVTGPGPTGHVTRVFFQNTVGMDASAKRLRVYDIKDVTPEDGSCPLG